MKPIVLTGSSVFDIIGGENMKTKFQLKTVFLSLLLVLVLVAGTSYLATAVSAVGLQPVISPTQPDGTNGYYSASQPRVSFSGYDHIKYKIDSGSWDNYKSTNCQTGSSIAKLFVNVPVGVHTIFFSWRNCGSDPNPLGNNSILVKYDPNSPNVKFSSPKENSTVNTNSIAIKGTVSDPTSPVKTLTINGVGVGFSGNGSFSKQVNLTKGLNRFVGVVYDSAGNSISKELFFTYTPGSQTSSNNQSQSDQSTGTNGSTTLGQTLGEAVDSTRAIIEGSNGSDEATSSATPSANTGNNDQTDDSKVEGSFFDNKVLFTLFILVILSSAGVLAFKTEALNRFFKYKFRKDKN